MVPILRPLASSVACVISCGNTVGACAGADWWPVRVPAGQPTLRARAMMRGRRAGGAESTHTAAPVSGSAAPALRACDERSPIGLLFHVSMMDMGATRPG